MTSHRIRSRPPKGDLKAPALARGDDVQAYLKDAAQTPGGSTPLVAFPTSEAEVAFVLREAPAVLPVGAQSSLTGGATPFGAWVLSLSRMDVLGRRAGNALEVGAGVALSRITESLRLEGWRFPPVPTFQGALIGGATSTNAAGAATFKYGSTRDWIAGLTVVLPEGVVLDILRGECTAAEGGIFEIDLGGGEVRTVVIPKYRLPRVKKCSAGYYAAPGMDLVDLFIGAEGTLGVVTSVRLRLLPDRPRGLVLAVFDREKDALEATRRLREAAQASWAEPGAVGLDVSSIEFMDRRSLDLVREGGEPPPIPLPTRIDAALLVEIEGEEDPAEPLLALLSDLRLSAEPLFAPLKDRVRAGQLAALREGVPLALNRRIGDLQRTEPAVHKTAADMVVPYERLIEAMAVYREGFRRRGLDHALWGHVSDGNVHANVIPSCEADVAAGEEAILEFGEFVCSVGGCPLSEHGVGRSPVKQALLRKLYGPHGIEEMRRVKKAIDPASKLAPGVLFSV